jgi:glycosyltransferase involved in cell wall biosynthesis
LRENFNINYKFILYVGSIEPRKNLKRLIDAYSLLDKNIKDEYKLLLVGYKGWNNKEIHSLVEKEKDYIKYLGYVSNEELAGLYSSTSVFAYMSLYEGFGLPPLEAMACGAPVLTSDIPCIREVCGDVALYADPWSIDSIFESLKQVINDGVLQKELSDKGLKHSKKFNWDITADKHISIFKELL